MYMKIHENHAGKVVAVCEKTLIGTKIQEGDMVLDLKAYKEFYCGDLVDETHVRKALQSFTSANLVGKNAVAIAISLNLIKESEVLRIDGIPHVQIYRI